MVDVDKRVIGEVTDRSQNVLFRELLSMIERSHPETAGITRQTLDAYAREFGEATAVAFTPQELRDTVDERLADTDVWIDTKTVYSLKDRISVYPARWHDVLGGTVDIPAYIRFIEDEVDGNDTDLTRADPGDGIHEQDLLDLVAIIGRTDRKTVKTRLEQLRDQGDIAEGADQHPDARVYLRERTDRRDPALDT
ncbi:hypothetical protein [Halocatena salina]|uniref:Uncharacterized protein n=1 Tax=Halocatena salina TaxID=2934340 RepID=A0A8U0A718_9EURY|nr:hypothetical protein [Halocatena salina]UPM44646.1 hypothetical protein MW046_16530 [Halocatena salina]